jgi:hypothetical protein
MIIMCNGFLFLMDPIEKVQDRVANSFTLLLALMALQYSVNESLPKVGFFTKLSDVFLLGTHLCTFTSVVTLIEYWVSGYCFHAETCQDPDCISIYRWQFTAQNSCSSTARITHGPSG